MRNIYFLIVLLLLFAISCGKQKKSELVILFTNDTHSQIVPNSDNKGGVTRRLGFIKDERRKNPNILLLDAGDFCQGSPYFNMYHGKVEVDALNKMGYDVVTLGNHEFDNGINALANILREANFKVVCANYDFSNTPLDSIVKPYVVITRNDVRIGIFGLTVFLETYVAGNDIKRLIWKDPYQVSQEIVTLLRGKEKCDLIICLSHLGSEYNVGDQFSDIRMADRVDGIDIIIGGHTHKIINKTILSPNGHEVRLVQTGRSGLKIGKMNVKLSN